jgi:glycosyltransferase involved in cell wall biosynthesis
MKILQIAPQIPLPLDVGGKIGIFGILKYLSLRGNEMYFAAYRKDTDKLWALNNLSEFCTPYIIDVQVNNSLIPALFNFFSPVPYNVSKFIKAKLTNFLLDFFGKNKVDIIHIDHLHLGWTIELLRNLTDAPVILREHNLEMKIMKRFFEKEKNPFIKRYAEIQYHKFIKYEPSLCEKFNKCIMITKEDEKDLLNLNSSIKTAVIPVGVETQLLNFKKKEPIPFSLFHIGAMNWLPNYDGLKWFLEEIFPKIIRIKPEIKLYLYGKETEKIKISSLVSQNVIVKGYVKNIWEEISDKQLAIIPLRIGSGIRVKIIEMLAAGFNIISTSIGKEGIQANDNEHILIADTAEEFINKTIGFFDNSADHNLMIQNARKLIREKYTWNIIAEQFESEYLKLIYNC